MSGRMLALFSKSDLSEAPAWAWGIISAGKIFPLGVELDLFAADIGRAGVNYADPGLEPLPLLLSATIFG